MSVRKIVLSAQAALVCTTLLRPSYAPAQDRFSLSSDRVAIYNLAGEVQIERGTGSNVVIEVTRGGDDADRLDIGRQDSDGWQLLIVRSPSRSIVYRGRGRLSRTEFGISDDGTFGLQNLDPGLGSNRINANASGGKHDRRVRISGSGNGLEAHADLRISIPAGKVVAIHSGVGKVYVNDVAADLQIDSRSGSVTSHRTRGFLRVDTGSGSISVESASGDVALNTGSGAIKAMRHRGLLKVHTGSGSVELAEVETPELQVSTGSGSVSAADVQAPLLAISTGSGGIRARAVNSSKFDLHTGSGSIQLDLLGDVDNGRVRTGSGGVTISTSSRLGADVTLDTGSGGIDLNVPHDLLERKRSFLRARLGDGQGTLHVNTGSGGITLR